jgi:competence protein ComEC
VQYLPQGWFSSLVWLIVAVALLVIALWSRWVVMIMVALLAGGLLGLWRGALVTQSLVPYEHLTGTQVEVAGVVKEDVEQDSHGALVVRLGEIHIAGHSLPGAVRVSLNTKADIKRGDHITVKGKLADGFGGFAATMHRASLQKIARPEPGDMARQVRDGFADTVRRSIDEPAVSLGLGYLLGQRRGLPEDLDAALRTAGLTHIVVASGYNLTILVRIARRLFIKVSKYLATLSAVTMIICFIAITGMSPSMSRAGLVTGLALLAWYYGRRFHPLVLLPFAAAITLVIKPMYGWGDLGWQLSFAAFAGVMIVAPLLQRYFFGEQKPGLMRQIIGETIAAFIVTLPILLSTFGQVSLVAIFANLLVLPLVPLAMLLVFLTGMSTLAMAPLGALMGIASTWLLQYMVWVAEMFAGIPWALLEVQLPAVAAVGMYVVIALGCVYAWRATRYSLRDVNLVE